MDSESESESELTTTLLLSLVALDAHAQLMYSIQTRKARTVHDREAAMARLLSYNDKDFKRRLSTMFFFLFYCTSIATTLTNTADSECGGISSITLSPKFVTNWNRKRNSQNSAPSIPAGAG